MLPDICSFPHLIPYGRLPSISYEYSDIPPDPPMYDLRNPNPYSKHFINERDHILKKWGGIRTERLATIRWLFAWEKGPGSKKIFGEPILIMEIFNTFLVVFNK